jgi:disease resistance protein RPS2
VGLIEDDLKLGVIGIWGPGGVGKTYLLKQIQKSLNGKTTVIFVTASRACSVSKLQKNLLQALELKGVDDEEIHRGMIHRFLEDKSFLLLLDDLWETIDLQAVGIPFPLGIDTVNKHKRKVVLTTRSITVCGGMEVRKQIKVPYLEENEAWELFRKKVGNETLSSPGIEDRARILVTEMKGLPLALITVGKAMYGKFHSAQWDSAIQHMIKSCCTDSKTDAAVQMERVVFGMIKFSYDDLESNTLRDCLSSCVLWPEDAWIDREDLARCWIGLGLVVEEDIQSSYTTAYSLMGNLTGACLLEDCGESNLFVKLHDVIRDMSLWISCGCGANNGKWSVRAGVGPDVKLSIPWSSAEYISLMSNDLSELPSVGAALELRVLCLKKNHLDETKIAGVLVNPAKLTYLDLSHNCLNGIPDSLCLLVELQHLDLSRNYSLRQVPDSFGKLIKLMFLYLQDTHITKIPEKVISRLTQLEIIDMRVTPEDCMSADTQSNVYRELGPLKHLKAVGTSVGLFESCSSHDTAADLPIRSLNLGKTRGEKFRIELDFSSKKRMERDFHLSDMLSFGFAKTTLYELNISDNSYVREIIIMQKSAQEPGSFGILKDLMMVGLVNLRKVKWMEISPTNVFPNLTSLMVSCCNKLCHLSWAMYLPRLERLGLDWVYMKNAFSRHHEDMNWRGQLNSKTFPCLKFLAVSHCKSLVTIADSDVTFPYLEVLKVTFCPNLQTLPFQAASLPPNLRVLEMDDAESWERLELEKGVKSFLGTKLQCRK